MTDLANPDTQLLVQVASRKGVSLDIRTMPHAARTPADSAMAFHVKIGQVVESLAFVAPRPGRLALVVCLVSGRNQVDLRQLAAVTGEVALRAASAREARDLTGCSVGGIPPFGHGRDVQVVMDQDLCQYQWVWAAAGSEDAAFRVGPRTLQMLSNAVVAPLAEASWMRAAAGASYEPSPTFEAGAGA
jgi:prolyl-tRNA editing enzyme YbaK/EbsC (Cys-tRNA(Pro) deacylase)